MHKLFATDQGIVAECKGEYRQLPQALSFDDLFTNPDPVSFIASHFGTAVPASEPEATLLRTPIQSQEVWAAGVTYLRSKTARMEEAEAAGSGDFYDRIYAAERPEIFFKATPQRVVGPGGAVRIRHDSNWNVPEPELTLAVSSAGRIFGFTIGNDMSSRDIEGQNPLYLTQAKVYAGSAALGPCLVVSASLPGSDTSIELEITRNGAPVFAGSTDLGQMKRSLTSLADYLFRDNSFPAGAWLMTGTGIVPPDDFSLTSGDEIRITIDEVGTLVNSVA